MDSPGILVTRVLEHNRLRKINRKDFAFKALTYELKFADLEYLMKLLFQNHHSGFQQLRPGTDLCVKTSKA